MGKLKVKGKVIEIDCSRKTCAKCKHRDFDQFRMDKEFLFSCELFFHPIEKRDHIALRNWRGTSKRCRQCLEAEEK